MCWSATVSSAPALALDQLHQPLVLVVDDHRYQAALSKPKIMLEEMLVDADLRWPGYKRVRR